MAAQYEFARKVVGLYAIVSKKSDRLYIGSSVNIESRWHTHISSLRNGRHHCVWLQRSFDKHGEDNFFFTILFTCEERDLILKEQRLLNELKKKYNTSSDAIAPMRGKKMNQATKDKISNTLKGRVLTKEHIEKTRAGLIGKPRPQSVIEALRIANTGKKASDETRAKQSAAQKASWTDERKASWAISNTGANNPRYGKELSQKSIENMRAASNKKPVRRIDPSTQETKCYESIRAAARDGFDFRAVQNCCKKKSGYISHKGFCWEFV